MGSRRCAVVGCELDWRVVSQSLATKKHLNCWIVEGNLSFNSKRLKLKTAGFLREKFQAPGELPPTNRSPTQPRAIDLSTADRPIPIEIGTTP
jgi:hypothetical protein